ncbi:TPA: AAA family ATPase [Legionella pneumophila]|nr:AAA family ATPase [Legionella pneumophila]
MKTHNSNIVENSPEEKQLGIVAVDLHNFLQMNLPPRENLLNPWLPKSGICMIYAKRGVGKTFFALEVAIAVSYGIPFLCFDAPKPSRVLYIDGEMPANVMQERLANIINRNNLNTNDALPYIITPDLQHNFMPNLSTSLGQESIREYTDKSDLIIVDNVSTLGGGIKENEAESWIPLQQWALGLRRQSKTVLFIHHAGKSGTQRGTSKREDILDTSIALKHPSDYEPSSGACFEIHFEKARSMTGESTNPIFCSLTDDGWHYNPIEENNYLKVINLASQGLTQGDIAAELGLSKGYISKLFKRGKELGEIK